MAGYETLPNALSEEDKKLVAKLTQEVRAKHNDIDNEELSRAIALAYHIHKEYEKNPDKAPKVQLAMAGAAIPIGIELISWLNVAVRAALAYISGEVVLEAAKVLLEPDEAKEYDHLYEKRKQESKKGKHNTGSPGMADLGSQMPDPDDLEPEDNSDDFEEYLKNKKQGDKIDANKIKFENAGYHHGQSTGIKSKAPTNPQEALKNTFRVKESSDQLIGVDKINNEIVVFNRSAKNGNLYHGHVVEKFGDLTQHQKNVLEINNLVKANGKIIK